MGSVDNQHYDQIAEQAILYLLQDLPADERLAFERGLHENSDLHLRAIAEAESLVAGIELAAPVPALSTSLRDKLLSRLGQLPGPLSTATPGPGFLLLAAPTESRWLRTPFKGVRQRMLYVDPQTQYATYLFKMAPGSVVPAHRHHGSEQCWVVQGDAQCGTMSVTTGDFFVAEKDTLHEPLTTQQGCILLIIGPPDTDFQMPA